MTDKAQAGAEPQAAQPAAEPAATPTPPEPAAKTEPDAAPKSWVDGFNDDLRGYVEQKGFKGPDAVVDAYRNLEKLRGVPADRLLTLPTDPSAEGAMDAVYEKLGRPKEPTEYSKVEVEGFSEDLFNAAAITAHKLGLNDGQFKGLQEMLAAQGAEVIKASEEQAVASFDKWQASNPDGVQVAAKVMAGVGVEESQLADILAGDKAALYDFLAKVGARSSEGATIHGESPNGGFALTPAQAEAKRQEKLSDKDFYARYTSRSADVRKSAMAEIEALSKIIVGSGQ